ncbi:hypothetical protein R3I94_018455 [Phoxinus phoxinus]
MDFRTPGDGASSRQPDSTTDSLSSYWSPLQLCFTVNYHVTTEQHLCFKRLLTVHNNINFYGAVSEQAIARAFKSSFFQAV